MMLVKDQKAEAVLRSVMQTGVVPNNCVELFLQYGGRVANALENLHKVKSSELKAKPQNEVVQDQKSGVSFRY